MDNNITHDNQISRFSSVMYYESYPQLLEYMVIIVEFSFFNCYYKINNSFINYKPFLTLNF